MIHDKSEGSHPGLHSLLLDLARRGGRPRRSRSRQHPLLGALPGLGDRSSIDSRGAPCRGRRAGWHGMRHDLANGGRGCGRAGRSALNDPTGWRRRDQLVPGDGSGPPDLPPATAAAARRQWWPLGAPLQQVSPGNGSHRDRNQHYRRRHCPRRSTGRRGPRQSPAPRDQRPERIVHTYHAVDRLGERHPRRDRVVEPDMPGSRAVISRPAVRNPCAEVRLGAEFGQASNTAAVDP